MGKAFEESDSDSSAMIVLEGQQPLGEDSRQYYAELVKALDADKTHVQHVQDLWGDRLTSSSVQSADGKATYVQLNLAGNQGTPLGDESVAAVRDIVHRHAAPAGVKVYVTGAAPLASDMQHSGNDSILKITIVTVVIIFAVLLFVYRSIATVVLLLVMVGIELAAARGIVAFLGANDLLVLSTFAVNMLVFLAIAAGTDYGIFFFGRYQEARQAGEDRETAYYTTYRTTTPVVLASGLKRFDHPKAVDVAGDKMTTDFSFEPKTPLEIHQRARRERTKIRQSARFFQDVEDKIPAIKAGDRETASVDRDTVANRGTA